MKTKFIVTKQRIRERFDEISKDFKLRYYVDLEGIYDKYDNHLPYHNKDHAEAVLYYTDYFLRRVFTFQYFGKVADIIRVAAYLHDVGHRGLDNKGNDFLNIGVAKEIINKEVLFENLFIIHCVSLTEFPYKTCSLAYSDIASILRTADMCQIFIKDIDLYKLCYDLHVNELQNDIPSDENCFMQQQYRFYESIAEGNQLFREHFNQHKTRLFGKWL